MLLVLATIRFIILDGGFLRGGGAGGKQLVFALSTTRLG